MSGESQTHLHMKAKRRIAMASLVIADWLIILLSTNIAYWVRFEGAISAEFLPTAPYLALAAIVVFTALLAWLKLYRQVWRYAGVDVLIRLSVAALAGTVILLIAAVAIPQPGVGHAPAPVAALGRLRAGCAGVPRHIGIASAAEDDPVSASGGQR